MTETDSSSWAGKPEDNQKRLRSLIIQGSHLAGGAVSGALGFLAGGPASALILGSMGVLASNALSSIATDISSRILSPREALRVGGVIALGASQIQRRIEAGEELRDDGFFDTSVDGRSPAEEIAESISLKAQREAEERKLPYLANLLASSAFHSWLTLEAAHQLARAAEDLSYRQLAIIGSIPKMDKAAVRQTSYFGESSLGPPTLEYLYEIFDLIQRGYVSAEGIITLNINGVEPSKLILIGYGALLYELMGLEDIPQDETFLVEKALQ